MSGSDIFGTSLEALSQWLLIAASNSPYVMQCLNSSSIEW